ncbi:MAG: metal-dependent hydrolase [Balneolales bacterium]|nr:metal-dependent hydrolase [Balneolales bacterium]
MDPLAHTLFGAALSEAGLKRKTALATATLVIGANIPDVDAVAMFISNDYALLVRRGWTHGILAMFLWPFILTGMMLGIDNLLERWRKRKGRERSGPPLNRGWLLALSFIGVWSHPLLDWLNTYGVRFLMPFDGTWFYGDTLFIIDAWFWLLTGAAVVLARSESWKSISAWMVLVTATSALILTTEFVPFAAKAVWLAGIGIVALIRALGLQRKYGTKLSAGFLIAAIVYTGLMYAGSRITTHHAKNGIMAEGDTAISVLANPLPARIFERNGVAASYSHYYFYSVNWLNSNSFRFTREPIPIQSPNEITQVALEAPDIQGMRNWLRFPHYEVEQTETGWRVFIRDLRYVQPDDTRSLGIGLAIVELDSELQVLRVMQ